MTVTWLHKKYIDFPARPNSSKVDGDVATLPLIHYQNTLLVVLILEFNASSEFLKVRITDAQTPWCRGRLQHGVYVICDLLYT